jgi:hypothetical protein
VIAGSSIESSCMFVSRFVNSVPFIDQFHCTLCIPGTMASMYLVVAETVIRRGSAMASTIEDRSMS